MFTNKFFFNKQEQFSIFSKIIFISNTLNPYLYMLTVISPAKRLRTDFNQPEHEFSSYYFKQEAEELAGVLKGFKPEELADLMNISADLAELNLQRYVQWTSKPNAAKLLPALFMFDGDVFRGIDADSLTEKEIRRAQNEVRILSGLYGVLRPLDLIMPYRLEMGTKLKIAEHKNLYEFWGKKITDFLNAEIKENSQNVLINLASKEYFKSVKKQELKADIYTPKFLDYKNGKYKTISFYAKKARGKMVRFILQEQPEKPEDLLLFAQDGYRYCAEKSKEKEPVFTRG